MRIRWLQVDKFSKGMLRRAVDGMAQETFSDGTNSGFLIERQRGGFIEAKFVERFDWVETISDPFGAGQEISRQKFQQTSFRLSVDSPTLEVYDAPRSISPFLNRLEVFLGLDFVVFPPEIEVLSWLREFEANLEQIVVTSATVARLSLSAQTFASISVRGTEDVRAQVEKFVGKRPYSVEKVVVSAVFEDRNLRFMLGNDSRANIISGSSGFVAVLRKGLANLLAPGNGRR